MNTSVTKAAMIAASMALTILSIGSAFAYTRNTNPLIETHDCFVVWDPTLAFWLVDLSVTWNKDAGKPSSLSYTLNNGTQTTRVPGKAGSAGAYSFTTATDGSSDVIPSYSMYLTSSTRQGSLDSNIVTGICASSST